jgi:nitrile hydratase subunit beta
MPALPKEMVPGVLATGASERVDQPVAPKFSVGQRVRARNLNPEGHTRVTQYVKGKVGTVEADYGVFIFPDTMAHGNGPAPQHVYNVSFAAEDLWGSVANVNSTLRIDLWDDHLDAVSNEDDR